MNETNRGNAADKHVTLGVKVGYGVGDLGANLVFQTVMIFLLFYFTDVFGIAASIAGTIFLVSKVWDGVSDPVMGYISDRTNTRWGKKRPYLLFGAPFLGITFFLLFASPPIPEDWKPAYALVLFLLVCTLYTVVNIPYGALTASITLDTNERSSITGYRVFCAIFGTLIVAGATKPLISCFSSQVTGFRVTIGIYCIFVVVLTLVTFFSVRETDNKTVQEQYKLTDIVQVIKSNPPFILLSIGMTMHLAAVGILAAMVNYYFKYTMDNESFTTIALLCIFVSAALSVPFWVFIAKKLSKRASFNLGMGLLALMLIAIYFIRDLNLAIIIPTFILAGIGISTIYFSPIAMIPDTVEYSQWKIGLRREGILYGFFYFGQKLAAALAGFIAGHGLGIIGFEPNRIQPGEVLEGIRVITTFVPIVLIIVGIIFISFYPIDEALHRKIVREIQERQQDT